MLYGGNAEHSKIKYVAILNKQWQETPKLNFFAQKWRKEMPLTFACLKLYTPNANTYTSFEMTFKQDLMKHTVV